MFNSGRIAYASYVLDNCTSLRNGENMRIFYSFFLVFSFIFLSACGSSSVDEALEYIDEDLLDAIDVSRKSVDYTRMGLNSFANDLSYGSISSQYMEVRQTLGLSYVRVLFAWNDAVQPTVNSEPNFTFYDDIVNSIPSGLDVLVVVTGLPSWMADPSNWSGGTARRVFAEQWLKKIVQRYGGYSHIVGWQIWNEPNMESNPNNSIMEFIDNPQNYVELLAFCYSIVKDLAPGKLVVGAATTSINQNYPETLSYNRGMRDAGAGDFLDVWAVHYYGSQYENVLRSNGVADFLNGLGRTIWVTESGSQGLINQLEYVEKTWPFLRDHIGSIDRIYYYQHTESTPSDVTYGLRNLESISDLYIALRDR